jgi:hypothetical protein
MRGREVADPHGAQSPSARCANTRGFRQDRHARLRRFSGFIAKVQHDITAIPGGGPVWGVAAAG